MTSQAFIALCVCVCVCGRRGGAVEEEEECTVVQ